MQTESETSIAQNARPLATQPLGRLMRRYAVPCMTSLVVAALYNMVDQVFIANAPDLGSVGNAATTVVFPLTVAALAIAVMLGDGCCAFVSLMLGAGKQEEAHRAVDPWREENPVKKNKQQLIRRLDDYDRWLGHCPNAAGPERTAVVG